MHFLTKMLVLNLFICIVIVRDVLGVICDAIEEENNCIIDEHGIMARCKGSLDNLNTISNFSALLVCSKREKDFNPAILVSYPNLENFTLFRSSVEQLTNDFSRVPKLKVVNITYNNIGYLRSSVFRKLEFLVILDLRFNKLRTFTPDFVSGLLNVKNVFLYGNQWDCNKNFLWIVDQNCSTRSVITDAHQLVCNKYTYKDKPLIATISMIQTLILECKEISDDCVCSLDHVVRMDSGLRPMIVVNCSNRQLKKLPPTLPNSTSTLIVSGNQISDLSPLRTNEKYLSLLNLYLDFNNISSINVLEDSPWLQTFQALSLLGNKLNEIPVYMLEQAFEKNHNIGKVTLGQNPWTCDCGFTPLFRDFLAKYRTVIKDIDNVTCSYRPNDDKSLLPILSLSRDKLCHKPYKFEISTLNILNVCMALLLAIILCDFAYNYYMYKKYGQLPWIAKRMS